jgi:hypothetical protein
MEDQVPPTSEEKKASPKVVRMAAMEVVADMSS